MRLRYQTILYIGLSRSVTPCDEEGERYDNILSILFSATFHCDERGQRHQRSIVTSVAVLTAKSCYIFNCILQVQNVKQI